MAQPLVQLNGEITVDAYDTDEQLSEFLQFVRIAEAGSRQDRSE